MQGHLYDLAPGESANIAVNAATCWNPTHLRLEAGSTYLLETGESSHWADGPLETGPEGFWALALEWNEPSRRVPEANWLALIGTINGWQDNPFVIGHRCVYTPLSSGELICYANSAPLGSLGRNGTVRLSVRRLTPTRHAPAPPPSTLPAMPEPAPPPPGQSPPPPNLQRPGNLR